MGSDGIMVPIRQPCESDEQWQEALAAVEKQRETARSFRLDLVNTPGDLLRYCQVLLQVVKRDAHQSDQVLDSLIRAIWQKLDDLGLAHLAPEEPAAIKTLIQARRAIRGVMKWCHRQDPAAQEENGRFKALRARLMELFPGWRKIDRDLYFYHLRQVEGLSPAKIRDRCRSERAEWKLSAGNSGREVVDSALKRTALRIKKSGLSA